MCTGLKFQRMKWPFLCSEVFLEMNLACVLALGCDKLSHLDFVFSFKLNWILHGTKILQLYE